MYHPIHHPQHFYHPTIIHRPHNSSSKDTTTVQEVPETPKEIEARNICAGIFVAIVLLVAFLIHKFNK